MKDKSSFVCILLFAVAQMAFLPTPHGQNLQRFDYSVPQMGTTFKIILYTETKPFADSVAQKVFQRIAALNQVMSDYQADSEVSRLTAWAGTKKKVKVSSDLFAVLKKSKKWARKTSGNFDVTIGPLTKLWRKAFRQQTFPDSSQIKFLKSFVNYKYLKINYLSKKVRLKKQGMRIDLGGIGKGYAIDEAMAVIKRHGIKSALVEGGGDILVSDPPPKDAYWTIQSPFSNEPIFLANQAIATSGDTYQYIEWQGKRYSHIISPKTGYGIQDQKPISIVARNCTDADALASACSIFDEKETKKWKKKNNYKIITWQ